MCVGVVQNTEDSSQKCPNGGPACGGGVKFASIADRVDRDSIEPETIAGSVDNDNQISQSMFSDDDDDVSGSQLILANENVSNQFGIEPCVNSDLVVSPSETLPALDIAAPTTIDVGKDASS
ncbi:hypothetical protein V6N11_057447 [Hibiscus sabdariffa]|uniref:Uncharacterized protein n=1 Tax=Hibiscus sabdariffa TaxID=183260 RepID=A0ABR2A681_9ROSI